MLEPKHITLRISLLELTRENAAIKQNNKDLIKGYSTRFCFFF